jgi:hypothetical protein
MGDGNQNFSNFSRPVVNFPDASQQEDQTDQSTLAHQAPGLLSGVMRESIYQLF